MSRIGIVLLGFGGPDCAEAVAPFMRALTGRDASPEACERIWASYEAIGGESPLAAIARRIAEKLEAELSGRGVPAPVRVGMAYWHPLVAEAVEELKRLGCDEVVGVSLSPYESRAASGACREALGRAAAEHDVALAPLLAPVASLPAFSEVFAERLAEALAGREEGERTIIVFTAHSLPLADLTADDPYVAGLRDVATCVARLCGLAEPGGPGETSESAEPGEAAESGIAPLLGEIEAFGSGRGDTPWLLAYQSKGRRGGEWLGPDLADVLRAVAREAVAEKIIACPIGFLTDHMETLYDLDIVAAEQARDLGLAFARITPPNDDPQIVAAIAEEIAKVLGKGSGIE